MSKQAVGVPLSGLKTQVMRDEEPTGQAEVPRKQHCWECLRRRLVCDSTEPVCTRCQKASIVCPGYGDQKPLTWLAPGKVAYRSRKPLLVAHPVEVAVSSNNKAGQDSTDAPSQTHSLVNHHNKKTNQNKLPLMKQLKSDKTLKDLFEAVCYFQEQIFTTYLPMKDVLPQASVSPLSLDSVRHFTPVIQNSFVCLAIGHRIHRMSAGAVPSEVAALWEVFYQHRGRALKALTESIMSSKANVFATIVNIGVFLASDVQHCYPGWHFHYEGAAKLIRRCGGPGAIVSKMPPFSVTMNSFVLYGIFANATSHRHHQLAYNTPYPEIIHFVSTHFIEELIAFSICPRELLLAIVQINHMRGQASYFSALLQVETDTDDLSAPTSDITSETPLANIQSFSPASWATAKAPGRPEVLLLARLLQSATTVYCIAALRSAGLHPAQDVELELTLVLHRTAMFNTLRTLLPTAKLLKGLSWPFTVAGYAAAQEGNAERNFIRRWCADLSFRLGEAAPLSLLRVFERFWGRVKAGGGDGWDDCFDGKYCFIA